MKCLICNIEIEENEWWVDYMVSHVPNGHAHVGCFITKQTVKAAAAAQ